MSEKLNTINIQGKPYVMVHDRVIKFHELYENGCIQTILVSSYESDIVVIKAKAIPDIDKSERYFTGYAQEIKGEGYINKTSALENAETSAIGRALGLLGIGIVHGIPSADEINKAHNYKSPVQEPNESEYRQTPKSSNRSSDYKQKPRQLSSKQKDMIIKAAADNMVENDTMAKYIQIVWEAEDLNKLEATYEDVNDMIQTIKNGKIQAEIDAKIDMDTGEIK